MPEDVPPEPSVAWKLVAALITAGFIAAVAWFIGWRSAPPMVGL